MEELRYSSTILDLSTRWRWVGSLTPRPLQIPGESVLGTHWIGSCVCPMASLYSVEKRKISWPSRNRTPAIQTIAHHYTNWVVTSNFNLLLSNYYFLLDNNVRIIENYFHILDQFIYTLSSYDFIRKFQCTQLWLNLQHSSVPFLPLQYNERDAANWFLGLNQHDSVSNSILLDLFFSNIMELDIYIYNHKLFKSTVKTYRLAEIFRWQS
jgi:hypothetical protein